MVQEALNQQLRGTALWVGALGWFGALGLAFSGAVCSSASAEAPEIVGVTQQGMTQVVNMRFDVRSTSRVMIGGAGDGIGTNKKNCCMKAGTTYANCPTNKRTKWDGTTLRGGGVFYISGAWTSTAVANRLSGPYQCRKRGEEPEWEFPPFIDGVAAKTSQVVASMEYYYVNVGVTFPSSVYQIQWKEADEYMPDDFFEWTVEAANWVNTCRTASSGSNGLYTVDSGLINGGNLCDRRGCNKGNYKSNYTVTCTVTGGTNEPPPPPPAPTCGAMGGNYCSQSSSCPAGYNSLGSSSDCTRCCTQGPSCGVAGGNICNQNGTCPAGTFDLGRTYDCNHCCRQ